MAHLYVGHHIYHTVHHAQTGPEYGHHGQLFAGYAAALGNGNGGLHVHLFQRQVSGGLIAHQHGDFGYQFPEFLYTGVFISEDGELMLDERVVENAYFAHVRFSFVIYWPSRTGKPGGQDRGHGSVSPVRAFITVW